MQAPAPRSVGSRAGIRATLSPRHVLGALRARLALDDVVVGDWRLFDAYRLSEQEPVSLELRRGMSSRETLRVDLEPVRGSSGRSAASVAGLALSYRSASAPAAGAAACEAIAGHLGALIGTSPRSWTVAPPSLDTLAAAVDAEVGWRPHALAGEEDASMLREDFAHYEQLYGERPQVRRIEVAGDGVPGISIYYPEPRTGCVPPTASVYAVPLRVAHRRRMRAYFGRLGCMFDVDARPRTVPTPSTFARALARHRGRASLRPRMVRGLSKSMGAARWALMVGRGELPIGVAPGWSVRLHELTRNPRKAGRMACDVGMLVHDMGLHALGLHAVPSTAWEQLLARARELVRRRPARVLGGDHGLLGRLAVFFEGPVTARCWDAWREAEEPEGFEAAFEPHFRALLDELREL